MAGEKNAEVQVGRSGKEAKGYSKRIIAVFILGVAVLLFGITVQAKFKSGDVREDPAKNYRIPQPSGFAELAASMRRDRNSAPQAVSSDKPEPQTRRIVIERTVKEPVTRPVPTLPRYSSNRDDAQMASQLRTLKMQALTAKPVVDDFQPEKFGSPNTAADRGSDASAMPRIMDSAAMAALAQQQAPDPNGQAGKQNFLRGGNGGGSMTPQGYSASLPVPQQFPYELKAGTIIPGLLMTGINSDLPGSVIAQVSENVWDTATGKYILIPKGARMLGVYDSRVSFGQRRVLLVWNRLIFPNGTTLDIAGSPGIDQAGYSGLSGKVNEHWGTMLKSALLASVFVAGAEIVYDGDSGGNSENKSPRDVAAESAAGSIIDMGTKVMNRAADIQPTISIRPGKKMGIFVQRDVVFPFPYFWGRTGKQTKP
ncbi:MAG: TrbI/VirB10 family protein [Synergistaceae bacterium]|nr:TrbI/VirB10 family protein [Synergistaceae bacterium]